MRFPFSELPGFIEPRSSGLQFSMLHKKACVGRLHAYCTALNPFEILPTDVFEKKILAEVSTFTNLSLLLRTSKTMRALLYRCRYVHLSNWTKLTPLCDGHELGKALQAWLISLPGLISFELPYHAKLGLEGLKCLTAAWRSLSNLQKIHLNSHEMDLPRMEVLAGALELLPNMETISLQYNFLKAEGLKVFANALTNLSNLKELNLSDSYITTNGMQDLVVGFQSLSKLKDLYLGSNNLGDKGIIFLVQGMENMHNIENLYLEETNMEDEGLIALSGNMCKSKMSHLKRYEL